MLPEVLQDGTPAPSVFVAPLPEFVRAVESGDPMVFQGIGSTGDDSYGGGTGT